MRQFNALISRFCVQPKMVHFDDENNGLQKSARPLTSPQAFAFGEEICVSVHISLSEAFSLRELFQQVPAGIRVENLFVARGRPKYVLPIRRGKL